MKSPMVKRSAPLAITIGKLCRRFVRLRGRGAGTICRSLDRTVAGGSIKTEPWPAGTE